MMASNIVFENGTMLGSMSSSSNNNLEPGQLPVKPFIIPEIVISASYSSNSLNRSRCDMSTTAVNNNNHDDLAVESTALLAGAPQEAQQQQQQEEADFEQFVLNRSTSESNILESSIYSELQFPPSFNAGGGGVGAGLCSLGVVAAPPAGVTVVDMLNTSACSRSESRQGKRTRRKTHKSKTKCSSNSINNNSNNALAAVALEGAGANNTIANGAAPVGVTGNYPPPQYTAIFLDAHHHHHGNTANAIGQLPNSAANSGASESVGYMQYHQCYQQRPMLNNVLHHHHLHQNSSRRLLDLTVPLQDATVATNEAAAAGRATREAGQLSRIFPKWLARPSLPFVIGIFAMGGVACTLGGIVLGSTGLIEHSTQYLSAALLMIGIGVSLLVISGAIWRLSLPDETDECPCFRRLDTCRNCNSPHCSNRLMGNYLYPEFQHRPPPPSYLTSLNEYAFVYHPAHQAAYSTVRVNTPPPLYRSTHSLSAAAAQSCIYLPANSEFNTTQTADLSCQEQVAMVYTREAVSQTSFKDIEYTEYTEPQPAAPCTREAVSQTSFKEAELD